MSAAPKISLLFAAGLCLWVASTALGQAVTGSLSDLTPRVEIDRPLLTPTSPIVARFTLTNEGNETVVIPLRHDSGADGRGARLPASVIWGDDEPALTVSYGVEAPLTLTPPVDDSLSDFPPGELRLAPGGVLGAAIDLRETDRSLRYVGSFELEWRPFGGRIGMAATRFQIEPRRDLVLITDYGKLTFNLHYDEAPQNVANFVELVRSGFYDGKRFHRLVPGLALQGGCPLGTGLGQRPDAKTVPAELSSEPFDVGTLAMSRRPDDLDSASCQFFIALTRVPELDGKYTIIGNALDDDTLRTLRTLSDIGVNRDYRPLSEVVIRSAALVRPADDKPTRLELRPTARRDGPSEATVSPGPRDSQSETP